MSDLPRQDTDDSADTGPHHESRSAPLDRYFALSDTAGHCKADFAELIALFTPDARLEPAGGTAVQGTTALREFFHDFFERNVESRHLWCTRAREEDRDNRGANRVVADWAVAVRRSSGDLAALAGTDTADLAPDGRIARLRVVVRA
jgi:hypothetical protein